MTASEALRHPFLINLQVGLDQLQHAKQQQEGSSVAAADRTDKHNAVDGTDFAAADAGRGEGIPGAATTTTTTTSLTAVSAAGTFQLSADCCVQPLPSTSVATNNDAVCRIDDNAQNDKPSFFHGSNDALSALAAAPLMHGAPGEATTSETNTTHLCGTDTAIDNRLGQGC